MIYRSDISSNTAISKTRKYVINTVSSNLTSNVTRCWARLVKCLLVPSKNVLSNRINVPLMKKEDYFCNACKNVMPIRTWDQYNEGSLYFLRLPHGLLLWAPRTFPSYDVELVPSTSAIFHFSILAKSKKRNHFLEMANDCVRCVTRQAWPSVYGDSILKLMSEKDSPVV